MGWPGWEVSLVEAMLNAVLNHKKQVDVIIYCYMMNDIEGYDPRTEQFLKQVNSRTADEPVDYAGRTF